MNTDDRMAGAIFEDEWLSLREPLDHASRAHGLARASATDLARRGRRAPHVVDLGTGTGSNPRYLARFLPPDTRWHLVDNDAAHLERLAATYGSGARPTLHCRDLAEPLAPILAAADLVTAAALIDLVSAAWIDELATAVSAIGAALLVAMSVDGHIRFTGPVDNDDGPLLDALAQHQRRDKGLGAALGTAAPATLINAMAARGHVVTAMPTSWHIDARHERLADMLLAGWAEAAGQAWPADETRFAAWARRRHADIAAGRTRLLVGHVDVLALPAQARPGARRSRS
ncbi:class I SAM-dependent methyltransferase [Salinisphaera sp. Q1T1-3]|uniref:class I SAM-dependent methyltransferase n=1 Tax=Salinisphaera sp. Q1T1-3 TaxID=2321229 RepID=UPI000E747ECA|nr:class I SAM-dependent methyltransferase [Salinisphaera sp. Q1T1-3]RJS92757.1 class I SAM-dependent methyltransferase [Salinisphaera sp. Q1T1-3]